MVQILDGYTGEANIFAEDIGEYNISLYGAGDYVLPVGECIGYELVSNNEIKIKDGMFITQGRRGLIKKGTTESCVIENGTQNKKRNDIIVMEYAKNSSDQKESHTLKVVKGTAGTAAADPVLITGSIPNGAVLHQMPLYRVKIEGLNVVAVEQMFEFGGVSSETVDPMVATETGFAADAKATKEAINNCFQSVSNGKALIASAITDKKVITDANASFATMAANIRKIKAAATALSGSKSIWVSEAHGVGTGVVTFSTPFSGVPQINYSVKFQTGSSTFSSSQDSITITRKTAAGFEIKTNGRNEKYGTYIIDWNATG